MTESVTVNATRVQTGQDDITAISQVIVTLLDFVDQLEITMDQDDCCNRAIDIIQSTFDYYKNTISFIIEDPQFMDVFESVIGDLEDIQAIILEYQKNPNQPNLYNTIMLEIDDTRLKLLVCLLIKCITYNLIYNN